MNNQNNEKTAAVGVALRNAGFGLQFGIAGDSFPAVAPDEFGGTGVPVMQPDMAGNTPGFGNFAAPDRSVVPAQAQEAPVDGGWQIPGQAGITDMIPPQFLQGAPGQAGMVQTMQPVQPVPTAGMAGMVQPSSGQAAPVEEDPFMPVPGEGKEPAYEERIEQAMRMPCPIKKYAGKTLGDLVAADPRALNWIAGKFEPGNETGDAARLLCEYAMEQAGA